MFNRLFTQYGKRPPKERAAMLGMGAGALLVLSVIIFSFVDRPMPLDQHGCPDSGPLWNKIIIIDRTGEIPESARRSIRTNIETIVSQAPAGTRFTLFEIDSNKMRGLSEKVFSQCKLRDGSNASPYNENPKLIRARYERDFHKIFMDKVESCLKGSGQERSPIMEALLDVTSVESFQVAAPLTVYIFSDLLQNTDAYSQYGEMEGFSTAMKRPEVARMIPGLAGVDLEVFYLLRNGRELSLQDNAHVTFWLEYFEAASARVQRIKKIR